MTNTSHTQPDQEARSRRALATALIGFFVLTLDALVVSVALPEIRDSLGGGIKGLQWVIDGYTLPFAAFLLLAGTTSDRIGARSAFGIGLGIFTVSSAASCIAPSLEALVTARSFQGIGAALMTPASLALIGEAYPNPAAKARAIGLWAVGGAVASASGPLVGGALTEISWRLIFLINLPVGVFAGWLLAGVARSPRRAMPIDWAGQSVAVIALITLTYGLIEAGELGFGSRPVVICIAASAVSASVFFYLQARTEQPMVPLDLFHARSASTPVAIGFTFMVGFYGMVFVMSLFLQEERGLGSFATGIAFLPVTGFSIVMPVLAARMAEKFGARVPISLGQFSMATGLIALSVFANAASVPALVTMMIPVGIGAGLAMPSATSLLLNTVPAERSGTASGVLNTSRQVGGAIGVAAFGALIASMGYDSGISVGFAVAGALIAVTMAASLRLTDPYPHQQS